MAHFDVSGLQPAADELSRQGIDVVRLGYCDLIGTDRGRDLLVNRFARTAGGGVAFCRSVYGTSPRGDVVDMAGGLSDGLPDLLAFPDV
jgi:glutamine synthetase